MSDSATTLSHMSHCDARRVGGGCVCLNEQLVLWGITPRGAKVSNMKF